MKNFISIIIPTYNEGKTLENNLKAIKNQDYKKYEIVVSDSKSKESFFSNTPSASPRE